ncbi:MAG: polymerase III, subunit gamma and tau protein [Candidatus Collierbacteria bacterium GW2011_GWC2_44_18]|uniref:DNA polymerase III subunit gamma/tau n=2 Tax=Microgenomates group TaxID=1794810 RepID=A0A0G1J7F1_9BACT|nr:MAG: polymerase III, subunit gamma and tau protein [Microgenomates group bacterium GW2011_GWC1_44_10]KKT48881.1 MAG: polymerase III, subunit gamma and tau protein [Candidatus Collierbacteria bacterium GW2011_GWC2_44_18]KKT67205.1 MAG: polymerase III, subunit gamma and tau protein [Candidatus Woesebacteria bacterium GW2011_GWA2_44_33]
MSFYQTYRPKKIADLDLESVRDVLLSTLSSGKISHAYLFVGPRGSGKTSTARILAQIVNCEKNQDKTETLGEPCGDCDACRMIGSGSSVDVIEIDAASNGLVDDIRDLRDKVRLSPVQLKKKIYIIDEVHMVSTAGFNALLKTLEEPPAHALFILCTTESQKVPETIASRCARVNFSKATVDEVICSLLKAVNGEKLDVNSEVLRQIAEATDGSFREGHKMLEQLSSFGNKIDEGVLTKVLGVVSKLSVKKLLEAVSVLDTDEVIKIFENMEKTGVKAAILVSSLLLEAKLIMETEIRAGENPELYLKIIDGLILAADRIKISPLPLLPIEIALLTVALGDKEGGSHPKAETLSTTGKHVQEGNIQKDSMVMLSSETLIKRQETEDVSMKTVQDNSNELVNLESVKTRWTSFLDSMAESNGSLGGMLRLVSPVDVQGKSLTISVTSRFQQDMLEREVKRKLIEEQMAKVWGPMTFKCILVDKVVRTDPIQEDENLTIPKEDVVAGGTVLSAAEKIFGN